VMTKDKLRQLTGDERLGQMRDSEYLGAEDIDDGVEPVLTIAGLWYGQVTLQRGKENKDVLSFREERVPGIMQVRPLIINSTNRNALVYVDLLFEDEDKEVRYLKTKVQSNSIRRVNLLGPEMDGDALHFNWLSLKEQGVPENAPFAARFLSDVPLVVSHKDHTAAYHAPGGML